MPVIDRVSVLSTGTVRIRPQHAESNGTPVLWWLSTSRSWTAPRPINVYVIEHRDGLVLFDTGQDRRSVTDPGYFPGGPARHLYRRLAEFDIAPEATLTLQLRALGYDIADVRVAIVSHLHQDHIGGLRELPHTTRVLTGAAELATADAKGAVLAGVMREHIRVPGVHWTPVTPARIDDPGLAPFTHAFDVMGDGSLMLLPTPGHTPGSMSLLMRSAPLAPMLFVGDLTYDVQLLAAGRVPGIGNARALRATSRRVEQLAAAHPGLLILAAHDPAAASMLRSAQALPPAVTG